MLALASFNAAIAIYNMLTTRSEHPTWRKVVVSLHAILTIGFIAWASFQ